MGNKNSFDGNEARTTRGVPVLWIKWLSPRRMVYTPRRSTRTHAALTELRFKGLSFFSPDYYKNNSNKNQDEGYHRHPIKSHE